MERVVSGMTILPTAQAGTGLSPEWDRWFDEEFTDLVSGDEDLVRAEFEALISAAWQDPPPPATPAAPSVTGPTEHPSREGRQSHPMSAEPEAIAHDPRPPPRA
jgi:hypothetical protein